MVSEKMVLMVVMMVVLMMVAMVMIMVANHKCGKWEGLTNTDVNLSQNLKGAEHSVTKMKF